MTSIGRAAALLGAAFAIASVSSSDARADVYACKDKEGVVRFADRKLRGMRCVLYAKSPPAPAPVDEPADAPMDGGAQAGAGGVQAPSQGGGTASSGARAPGMSRAEAKRLAAGGAFDRPSSRRPTGDYAPIPPSPPSLTGASMAAGRDTGRWSGNEPERLEERERLYWPFLEEAAELYALPVEFIAAVVRVESNFRYKVTSNKGAMGLMQLMPVVVREMGVTNPWDPRANVMGGARLLRVLADRYEGDMVKVLAAYHAGSGAVKSADGIPYEATESYVRSVLDRYYDYRSR